MAIYLPNLQGDWQVITANWLFGISGSGTTVGLNTSRLAIGFTYDRNDLVRVTPVTPTEPDFWFYLQGPGSLWFRWQDYSVLVSRPWVFENTAGGISNVTTLEIYQSGRVKSNVP